MERLFDKAIVFACCMAIVVIAPFSLPLLIALLGSLIVGALFEILIIPQTVRQVLLVVYLVSAVFVPEAVLFLPIIVYDCFRTSSWILRIAPAAPLVVGFTVLPLPLSLFSLAAAGVAGGFSLRTNQIKSDRSRFLALRDDLRETSMSLEEKNRDLLDKQDYEVSLATLNERGRIAREIHDNVGHLLTRSVLQVEALQVVHASDPAIKDELSQVGATLHEALDTVRKSVHDLHDDSFDLHTQLLSLAQNDQRLVVEVEYDAIEIPQAVGYCLVAIVREGISNAIKHSNANRVSVSAIEYPGFYRLLIHDNGTNAPEKPQAASRRLDDVLTETSSTGIGLQTMEDRARALGGVFRTSFDRGFRIFVSIPKGSE